MNLLQEPSGPSYKGESNTPPAMRTFGGNSTVDATFNQPNLSSPLFSDDRDDRDDFNFAMNDDDISDHKRRRIARACDLCRRRKIKCDGRVPCAHCKNYNSECVYHFEQKARKPAKTAKYIEGLENRLMRMEHLLRLSGLLGQQEEGKTDLGILEQRLAQRTASENGSRSPVSRSDPSQRNSRSRAPDQASPCQGSNSPATSSPAPPMVKKEVETEGAAVDDLAEMMDSLMTNNHGETRYIGSSSGFSIISPRGIQWVSEKLGDQSFSEMVQKLAADDNKWYHWRPEVFKDIFRRNIYTPLPPQAECVALVVNYFDTFNNLFPLFHEPTFMHLVAKQYSDDPFEGSGWWASLNVALAISYKTQAMKDSMAGYEDQSWSYFKNALAVISELTLRNTDLLSVQALLGMTLFLQGTPNPQPSFVLVGSAIRLAHSIGLHKRGSAYGFNEQEMEQRKRVFWIAYMMDKDISLRSGRPPAQDDDDWNVELPSEDPLDGVGNVPLPDGSGKINLFRKFAEYAIINGKVYSHLYSVKASKQTDGELLATISELDQELEQWKDSLPVEFRPETGLQNDVISGALSLHLTLLHLGYYNSLTTIHRRSIHHGYWTGRLAQYAIEGRNVAPLNHRVFSSAALCVTAARISIALLNKVPPNDYTLLWLIVYYPCSALMTLFANILQNPQDPHARPDLKLMYVVVERLATFAKGEPTGSMLRMSYVCKEFARIAGAVLDKAEKEMSTRQRRKQERDREKYSRMAERSQLKSVVSSAQLGTTNNILPNSIERQQPPTLSPDSMEQANSTFGSHKLSTASHPSQSSGFSPLTFTNLSPDTFFDPLQLQTDLLSGIRDNDMANMPDFSTADFQYQFDGPDSINVGATTTGQMFNSGSFQQPFVPQDLWTAPMTFEWDWADLGNM